MLQLVPDFDLQAFNTLAAPVHAEGYVRVTSLAELQEALAQAAGQQRTVLPLGGGSNIVLTDNLPGWVIHLGMTGIELVGEDDHYWYVKAGAGENWHHLVEVTLANHWWGLENLSLIPGSVGAAPIQNIGAYGVELESRFWQLTALDIHSRLPVIFNREACEFGYRDSIFKGRLKDQYIIVDVTLQLLKTPALNLSYPALRAKAEAVSRAELTPVEVSRLVCEIRREKLPDPARLPNAGSFFKNPLVTAEHFARLQSAHPDIVAYPAGKCVKLAAGWLIDQAGWRGYREAGVAVHAEQALVLLNPGREPCHVLMALAHKIQASVQARYGVSLEVEPRIYP